MDRLPPDKRNDGPFFAICSLSGNIKRKTRLVAALGVFVSVDPSTSKTAMSKKFPQQTQEIVYLFGL